MKTMGATMAVVASSAIFAISGYLVQAGLARVLGPADFARFAVPVAVASGTAILVTSGVPQAAARLVARMPQHAGTIERHAWRIHWGMAAAVTGCFIAAMTAWGWMTGQPMGPLLASAAILPCYALAGYGWNILVGHGRLVSQAATSVAGSLTKLAFAIVLGILHGPVGALLGYAASGIVQGAAAMAVHRRIPHSPPSEGDRASFDAFGPDVAWSLSLGVGLAYVPILDLVLADAASAAGTTGLYAAASTLGRVPMLLTAGLGLVFFPAAARGAVALLEGTTGLVVRLAPYGLAATAFLLVGLRGPLLGVVFGGDYAAGDRYVAVLPWAGAALAGLALCGQVLFGAGHGRWALASTALAGTAVVAVGLVAERQLGLLGFAVGSLAGASLGLALALLGLHRTGFSMSGPWLRATLVSLVALGGAFVAGHAVIPVQWAFAGMAALAAVAVAVEQPWNVKGLAARGS